MITQQLEEYNVDEVNALHQKMDSMTKHVVEREEKLSLEFQKMRMKENEMMES